MAQHRNVVIDPNKTYYVNFAVDARFVAEVKGNDFKTLLQKATEAFWDADFGDASDVDGYAYSIEDEEGNFIIDGDSDIAYALGG